jgi:hypothetical protein
MNENQIQTEIVNYYKYKYSSNKHCCIFSVPNGGNRNAREAASLKRTGVLAGVSDLIILHYTKVLFVEVKTPKGVQSKSQKYFQKIIDEIGHIYFIVKSLEEFILKLDEIQKKH